LFENYDEDLKAMLQSLKGKLEGDVKQLKGGKPSTSIGRLRTDRIDG
jgi:vesicle transport through interaction with t-SNAREs protein 1